MTPLTDSKGKTGEMGAESTEIFTIGIRGGGFSLAGGLAIVVHAEGDAVRSAERTEVAACFLAQTTA